MAAGNDNNNDMDAVDYEHLSHYHLYIGNHFDQYYQEYLKNQQELSATVPSQQQQPRSGDSQPPSETPKDHPTSHEFEKTCRAIADPACGRLAAETRQNVKLIEPRTMHTYRYTDAKTGEMVERGIKPDMIVAFSRDGVRGKNVVVDAKSHKGLIAMKDYDKLERDRSVTKCSYAILFINTNSEVPDSVLKAVEKNSRMDIIRYNGEQPDVTSKEFVDKVGPHVGGSTFRADDQRYEQNRSYVQKSDLKKQKSSNPLGNQNCELTKNTYRQLISYEFQHPRKSDGSLDREHPLNEGLKEDGTPDMRLKENKNDEQVEQHLTQEGEPDKRFNDNKSEKQLEAHVTKEGEPDHRYKENQEQQDQHLKADGTADKRFKESQDSAKENTNEAPHLKHDGTLDQRYAENQQQEGAAHSHLKADGTPDERFSENKDQEAQPPQQQSTSPTTVSADTLGTSDQSEHLKNDGTPDMRYKDNQEAAASAEVQTSAGGGMSADVETSSGGGGGEEHLKGNGTLDMRYNSSRETVAEMGGGEDISAMSEGMGGMNLGDSIGAGGGGGPSKADGTPDMRFSANQ